MLRGMSWESVDALPDPNAVGSPYQAASEPVLARRAGLSAWEQLRLFWRSTPELPSRRAARVVVLTPNHVYVERMDGTRQRARREAFKGRRTVGPHVVYGVVDAEDLALLARPQCPVMAELDARFRASGDSEVEPVAFRVGVGPALLLAALAALPGVYFLTEYSLESMWDRIHRGLYTAEVVLGVVAGFAAVLASLALLLSVPVRWRIDTLGVHRARGIVPWLHYLDAADSFRAVMVRTVRPNAGGGAAYSVLLMRRAEAENPMRVRGFFEQQGVIGGGGGDEAMTFATQVGRLLGVAVERSG